MATVILRPASTTIQTGWATTNAHIRISDDDTSTGVTQNNVTCSWEGTLDDLDSSLSGATINSFTISANAKAGRAGACNAWLNLIHVHDGAFASELEAWTGTQGTRTTTARTTQQDGSSALTYTYINDCSIKIDPNNQGITLYELYVTVDYTLPAGYGNDVIGVASANIGKVNGVATADIDKVIGV